MQWNELSLLGCRFDTVGSVCKLNLGIVWTNGHIYLQLISMLDYLVEYLWSGGRFDAQ
jgi:hypothetical protein